MDHIQKEAGNTADIIFGVGSDEELGDAVSVLVIATGFSNDNKNILALLKRLNILWKTDQVLHLTENRRSKADSRKNQNLKYNPGKIFSVRR
jgi:cell division GTPase FtsZ